MVDEGGVDDSVGTWLMGYAQALLCLGLLVILPADALPHQGLFLLFLGIQAAIGLAVGVTAQLLADASLPSYRFLLRASLAGFHAGFATKAWLAVALLATVWPAARTALWLVAGLAGLGVYGAVTVDRRVIPLMFLLPEVAYILASGALVGQAALTGAPWAASALLTASGLVSLAGTLSLLVLRSLWRGKGDPRNPLPEQFNHNALFHAIGMVSFLLLLASARSTT